jgi:hypothetical protein
MKKARELRARVVRTSKPKRTIEDTSSDEEQEVIVTIYFDSEPMRVGMVCAGALVSGMGRHGCRRQDFRGGQVAEPAMPRPRG